MGVVVEDEHAARLAFHLQAPRDPAKRGQAASDLSAGDAQQGRCRSHARGIGRIVTPGKLQDGPDGPGVVSLWHG